MKAALVFLLVCFAEAVLWWVAGFNFDRRGGDVAYLLFLSLAIAIFISFAVYEAFERD